jgi:hypothetical protein
MSTLSGLPFVGLALAFAGPALLLLVIGVIAVIGAIRVRKFKPKGVWWHLDEVPELTTSDIAWAQRAIWSHTRARHAFSAQYARVRARGSRPTRYVSGTTKSQQSSDAPLLGAKRVADSP